jgi:transcriptional regulator with XRE-family HTH domain
MKTTEIVLPDDIAAERERLGLTQAELADAAGIRGGRSHLYKIETGAVTPGVDLLRSITQALQRADLRRRVEARIRGSHTIRHRGDTTGRRIQWT